MADHRILVIPDLHAPFHCEKGLQNIIKYAKKHKPTHIVQIGDALDLFAFSRFAKSLNDSEMTAKQELFAGVKIIGRMWKQLQKDNPRVHCFQMRGNHSARLDKRLEESNPELCGIVDLSGIWRFPKVNTIYNTRQELIINNIMFIHGYRSKLGDHTKYNHMSVVHGHCHRPGIAYIPIKGKSLFEMDVGHCIDIKSIAVSYMPQKTTNWTKSFGWIDKHGPRVICLG